MMRLTAKGQEGDLGEMQCSVILLGVLVTQVYTFVKITVFPV